MNMDYGLQSTSLITTLGGASKKCPYSRSVVIPEVSLYVLQLDRTLLWAWKFCLYSRIVVISAVVISEVNCKYSREVIDIMIVIVFHTVATSPYALHPDLLCFLLLWLIF